MKSVSLAAVSIMGIAFKLFENKIKDNIQKFKNVRILLKQIIIAKIMNQNVYPFILTFLQSNILET